MAVPDTVGALAAAPGGRELGELLARVQRIDPEVLRGAARRLAAMTEGLDGSLRAIGRHGAEVRNAWQGRSADALTGYLDDFGRAGTQTIDTAGRMRARIDDVGRELAGLRQEVDAHVSRALDAARRARAEALADPARAPVADQLAAAAMAEPTAAARSAVARAETSLADAASALRELAGSAAAFSRLPAPDTRPIAADPAGWTAVEQRAGASVATVPAADTSGAEGIDRDGGSASSGDFTDLSSLDGSPGEADSTGDCSGSGESSDASVADASDSSGGSDSGGSDSGGSDSGGSDSGGAESDSSDGGDGSGAEASGDGGSDSAGTATGDGSTSEATDSGGTDSDSGGSSGGEDGSGSETSDEGGSDSGNEDAGSDDQKDGDGGDRDDRDQEGGAVTSTSADDGAGGATPTGGPQGQVGDWIREAMKILQTDGVPMDKMDPDDIATIIDHESGGDPDAINNSDSNAAKGTPSQGLMQTIGPTFDAYKLAGHGEITDPVDNIIAGVRYAIDRYGSVSEVPGVKAVARGDSYVGY